MSTNYYIAPWGSDAAAGTSVGAPWKTFNKLLGATGMASGDTGYAAPGVYREVVTIAMTSATAETKIIGDVSGAIFGVPGGEVQWTAYLTNDKTGSSNTSLLTFAGRDFLTFQNIYFQCGAATAFDAQTNTSTDIKFTNCNFAAGHTGGNGIFFITSAANVALNWTFDSCLFVKAGNGFMSLTPVRPATADFDLNMLFKNCMFILGSATCINLLTPSGANSFNPGGVRFRNCSHLAGGNFITTTTANWSTTIPCEVYNCLLLSGGSTCLIAAASGQIVEDYNFIMAGTARSNVTAGAHSRSDGGYAPLFFNNFEFYSVGSTLMPFGMPKPNSPLLGFGNQSGSPTTDILGAARPSGTIVKWATGTATAGAAKTLTDSGATWGTNAFAGYTIKIISGTGSGQTKNIASNTATVITVDGNWKTNPSTDSVYEVYSGANSSTGTATSGSTTTLTDSNAAWGVNQWAGYTLTIDSGTGSGQTLVVVSNTATVLTFATATAPDNTSTYSLFRGTDVNTVNAGVGCYEYGNSAVKDTANARTGSICDTIAGPGFHDYEVPVDAVSTTITVYVKWDAAYSGTKPSMKVLNGGECGVSDATATATGSAGSYELLTLTFTPTAKGVVTIRIISSTTTPTGNIFYDDSNVA